jgi:hypothetical protein
MLPRFITLWSTMEVHPGMPKVHISVHIQLKL